MISILRMMKSLVVSDRYQIMQEMSNILNSVRSIAKEHLGNIGALEQKLDSLQSFEKHKRKRQSQESWN